MENFEELTKEEFDKLLEEQAPVLINGLTRKYTQLQIQLLLT